MEENLDLNERLSDVVAKQSLNVILLVDKSGSMRGEKLSQVNKAIKDIISYLKGLQQENANINFNLSLLIFGDHAEWQYEKPVNVDDYNFNDIVARGTTNLHETYHKLNEVMEKQSKGGIMPDFGGIAPIIILLTDGHPNRGPWLKELQELRKRPWFKVALKYGVSIGIDDDITDFVLKNFVDDNGDILKVLNINNLAKIIKIIVLTASKVKSSNSQSIGGKVVSKAAEIKQEIKENLDDIDDWEW